jgi:hypothetical protein
MQFASNATALHIQQVERREIFVDLKNLESQETFQNCGFVGLNNCRFL